MVQILGFIGALVIFAILSALASESRSKSFTRGLMKSIDKPLARAVKTLEKAKAKQQWSMLGQCLLFPPLVPVLMSKGLDDGNWPNYVQGVRERFCRIREAVVPHNTAVFACIMEHCSVRCGDPVRLQSALDEIMRLYLRFHELEQAFFAIPGITKLFFNCPCSREYLKKQLQEHGKSADDFVRELGDSSSALHKEYASAVWKPKDPKEIVFYIDLYERLDEFLARGGATMRRLKQSVDAFTRDMEALGVHILAPDMQVPPGDSSGFLSRRCLECGEKLAPGAVACSSCVEASVASAT